MIGTRSRRVRRHGCKLLCGDAIAVWDGGPVPTMRLITRRGLANVAAHIGG